MTELYVLDWNLTPLGIVDEFESLIWTRRYYSPGEFELHTTPERFRLLRNGVFIHRADTGETAMIERLRYERDGTGGAKVIAQGRLAEGLLSRRVVNPEVSASANAETIIRRLVDESCISSRAFGNLSLGSVSGVGGNVDVQIRGDNLMEAVFTICSDQEISPRVRWDAGTNKLLFTVWQGKDRTSGQSVNSWAIFSDDFENIADGNYMRDITDYKNYAYVRGIADDESEVLVTVDQRNGANRRELWIDATDLDQTTDGVTMSLAEFRELLTQRGRDLLAEYPINDRIQGKVGSSKTLIYRQDFDLGDICEYVDHQVGVQASGRVTEVVETIENNSETVTAVLGENGLTVAQKIIRREKTRR